ncbi:hypothetical protein JJJ17_09590 [Paracoccus caeni]|uniref:Uncharacterized protein n=1 Tax=Paracoccus caeni TaxID=657651 RepID=A0A934SFR0_9RHOB|nr:hypothetical protein [Paracoccus caeni]MBK4216176.1 hypothetical protein [Paracoccus caeni]
MSGTASISGFVLPKKSAGGVSYDGAIFCHLLGFTDCYEYASDHYMGDFHVVSSSDQHMLMFHGLKRDYQTDPMEELGGETFLDRLAFLEARVDDLYEFRLELYYEHKDAAARFASDVLRALDENYEAVFDVTDTGERCPVSVRFLERA